MGSTPTVLGTNIPNLSTTDIVNRLLASLPTSWFSDSAKQKGGVLYSLLTSWATNHQWLLGEILYTRNLTRISTATGRGLDTVAEDFFGDLMKRFPGETDAAYRVRIAASLFLPRVTRQAIINLLTKFIGTAPTLTQPDYPEDVAIFGTTFPSPPFSQQQTPPLVTYYDIDIHDQNSGRYGDILPYTGFIDATVPFLSITGGRPVYGYDSGVAFGDGNSAYFNLVDQLDPSLEKVILNLINASIAEGTLIGVRFLPPPAALITSTIQTVLGQQFTKQTNPSYTSLLRSYLQGIAIFVETLPWLAHSFVSLPGVNFEIGFSTPAPDVLQVGWGALSLSFTGVYQVPVLPNQQFVTINVPGGIPNGLVPIIQPSWNTGLWIQSIDPAQLVIGIASPGAGFIYFFLAPGFIATVDPGAFNGTVTLPNPLPGPFPIPPSLPYACFVAPTWNTDVAITSKSAASFNVEFGIPAPGDLTVPISPANRFIRPRVTTLRGSFKPFKHYLQPRLALESAPSQQGGNLAQLYCAIVEGIA